MRTNELREWCRRGPVHHHRAASRRVRRSAFGGRRSLGVRAFSFVHSVNPIEAWLASQNGLLAEAPQRQSVTRLRIS